MKNAPLYRRILSVALVIAMIASFLVPLASAETVKADTANKVEELTLTPIDPGTLKSQKTHFVSEDTSVNKEEHALTDVVRVSIALDKAATLDAGFKTENIANNAAARAYRDGLRADQAAVIAKIEKATGSKLDVKWNLTLAANIISANVQYGQIDTIKGIDGVSAVFLEVRYEPQVTEKGDEPNNGAASYMIGSNLTWAAGYTGAGSKVAVIDTGIDTEHLSFDGEALEYALAQNAKEKGMSYDEYVASLNLITAESIEAVKDQLNANIDSGDAAHISTKIAYGYNYVDKNLTVNHIGDSQGEHGSHVEGISAANRFVKVNGEFKPALEAVGTQGVAPDAQIVTMKVFGAGGGAYDSDYMVAIEDAIILGCDSANLSLGSGAAGFGFAGQYEEIMNKLVENGMVVSISMGNSYGWYDTPKNLQYPYLYIDDANYSTGGSPGSFTNSLTVASVDNLGQTGMPLKFGDLSVFYSETSGYGNTPIATLASQGELEYVLLDGPGVDDNEHVGQEGDAFMALGRDVLEGKVAMCYRGTSSFFAKANAAVAQGAVAVVIINNTDGVINMNLTGYNYTAPAVSITQADGASILAQSEAHTTESGLTYYTGTMSVAEDLEIQVPEVTDTVTVSSFSSYGVPGTLVLKPEILAPGGSIYSVFGANNGSTPQTAHDQYEVMSGTSMAAPQVNGMAGVLAQYIRENGLCEKTGLSQRQLINSLLMSTAHPVFDADGNYWPVIRVGAGLGNVADAVAAKSYILMDEDATMFPDSAKDGKVKVELGDDPDYTGEYSFSFTVYPMEGKKEFTLRTDIFTQGVAGDGGYGMLQDTATMLIGSVATYEVNGETFEDAYLVEADVNKDGTTDAADAQAILDHITGAEAEDAEFDAKVADVDGDGKISSYDAKLILDSCATPTISITEPTKVTVNLKIDEDWMALLLGRYFTKGFYIQGYTYVEPVADEEGAMDVVHSIPIMGYLGGWTDPAMLDRTSVIDEAYGTGKLPYVGTGDFNYMVMKDAEGASSIYMGNPYMVEDVFPADRLAMNSEATIASFNYLNIRNLSNLGFAVMSEDGKVLYSQVTPGNKNGAYYYVNGGTWQNTNSSNYSVGKKLSAAGVQEGDKVNVGFYALPEYYAIQAAKMNGEVAASGYLNNDTFKAVLEAGIVGPGAGMNYTVTVDNTAPVVKGAFRDLITGDITVKASDNAYIAYVGVTNKSGTKQYVGIVPKQSAPGEEIEVPLDLEGQKLPNEVVLLVGDYAGNEVAFKVNLGSGEEEDNGGLMIGFTSANGSVGSGNRALQITPEELYYASASDFGGVGVYSNTNFKVDAAEYVDGYVFMAANDGWFYAAPLDALDEAEAVGKYSDTTEKVYDMAFNYENNKLYVMGMNNTIYEMDLITGKLTPVVVLTLNGTSGVYAVANTLAIDDNGTFYVANYGATSSAKLFKFELPEEEEPAEPEPEAPANLVAGFYFDGANEELSLEGWTFVDKDGDGKNWSWSNAATPGGASGDACIVSHSYQGGVLTPDNWAISPAVDMSNRTNSKLSFYAQNWSSTYADTIAVYVGTTPNPDEMTKLGDDFIPVSGSWNPYVFDLPEELASAPEVYAAIRHYNCTDMFRIYIDSVEFLGDDTSAEEPVEPEEPVIEPVAMAVDAVGTMGVWNYSLGGAMAWDHNTGTLYFAGNFNATTDTDHNLFTVNTTTGKATKAGAAGKTNPGRFYVCLTGLFIVPGHEALIKPTDEPTDLLVEPEELNLLKGQSVDLRINVMPWTLTEKGFTIESADPEIAKVNDKGIVTGVEVGETKIIVTTVAEPTITKEVKVTVENAPEAQIRGIIWDENGKGQASVFDSNSTSEWTAEAQVGAFRWGVLVDDKVYGSTDDTMYYYDADTYEVTTLGGIVSDWIPSDGIAMPEDMVVAWGLDAGFRVGGLCNNGTYFEVLNAEKGNLNYWNLSTDFSADPMAVITIIDRGDFTVSGEELTNALHALMITESGKMWDLYFDMKGSLYRVDTGKTIGVSLEGVADVTNETWASLVYDAENEFLYLSLFNGTDDFAHLYAIDYNDPSRMAEVGTFNENVWPVVGLHEYDPATDLVLKVEPEEIEIFETQTAEVNIKVKMGETNEYTAKIADPTICSFEDGVVTGLKEGETDITITTVDVNKAGEHLTKTVHVTVKALTALNLTVKGQVTDAKGARFTSILLDGPTAGSRGPEAPFDVTTGGRFGDHYMAGTASTHKVLTAEGFEEENLNMGFAQYSTYPPTDVANYPSFIDADGEYNEKYVLFPVSAGYLVTPDLYGWNLSSYVSDMAGFAFAGLDEADDGSTLYIYYMLTASGVLYEIDINPAAGSIANFQALLDTGITVEDQNNLSMAFVYGVDVTYSENAESYGLVIANNEDKTMWFIDFQTGEIGMIGTLDADNVSGLVGYFDEIVTTADEIPVDPFDEAEVLKAFDFEADPTDWTFVDKDGDGYTWAWNHNISSWYSADGQPDYDTMAYEGTGSIVSASFINTVGELTPDNWAVSPAIDLSEADEGTYFSFFAKGVDSNYAAEHFAIYAGTSPNPDEMTQISEEFVLTGSWKRYYADLSDFAGESEVYVAIRHFNVSDMFIMDLDKAEILTGVNMGDDSGAIAQPIDYTARAYTGAEIAKLGDGIAVMGNAASMDYAASDIEMVKVGEATNAVVGGTDAIKGEVSGRTVRLPVDETTVADGNVQIILTEDKAVTNGLITVEYDKDVLTYVNAMSTVGLNAINAEEGKITFAYAAEEEIPAETALLTLNFTYEGEVDTTVTVTTLERNDDVAVEEKPVVIEIKTGEQPPVDDEEYVLTTTLKDGDQVVIYNPGAGKAMSNETLAQYYRAGKDITPVDNKVINPSADLVWTVHMVEGGFELLDAEGHKLSMSGTNNSLPLDSEHNVWKLESDDAGIYIVNVNAPVGKNGDPKAVEWYASKNEFSGYYLTKGNDAFIMELYAKTEGDEQHDCPCYMFEDMPEYGTIEHTAIDWAYTHTPQITLGTDATHFSPDATLKRYQMAYFLWRVAGCPEPTTTEDPFVDCQGKSYEKAVLWMVENGYTVGTDATHYNPHGTLTIEQVLTFVWRYMGKPEPTITENPYSDLTPGKSSYKAALWCYENGIYTGKEDGTMGRKDPCTRVQTVVILYLIDQMAD